MTEQPKIWKAGIADEVWKVIICGRDIARADEIISWLSYILTDGGFDTKAGIAKIRTMSGAQIIDALERYRRSCSDSVQKAIGNAQEPTNGD